MNNKENIKNKYKTLASELATNYNQVRIIDDYDFFTSNPYTRFYLSKNEDFNKFKKIWNETRDKGREQDLDYDDILWEFEKNTEDIDCIELGTLDIWTDETYKLEI